MVNGVRLHYLDWGGAGPPLILIPGFGDTPHCFDDLAPALSDRYRVVAYARRGHGRSEAKSPYDTDTLVEDLRSSSATSGSTQSTWRAGRSGAGRSPASRSSILNGS